MTVPSFPDVLQNAQYPITRSASGRLTVLTALNQRRTALPQASVPRWSWTIPIGYLRSAFWGSAAGAGSYTEWQDVVGFFNDLVTTGGVFDYTDPEDYQATNQSFGAGDGTTVAFQLVRTMGGFTEPVYRATPTDVQVNGVSVDPGDYTVSDKGVVTFAVAPGVGETLVWTGTFNWLCRFDVTKLELARFLAGVSKTDSIKFSAEIAP